MNKQTSAFTLIEMSIVLVIIGLIVGSVLVGQDLVRAAGVRATVSQVEKFNAAVNTFRGKYGYLPGDINAAAAATFGFTPRGTSAGQGDGNGFLEGYTGSLNNSAAQGGGETGLFWVDLTTANGQNVNLIEGSFNTALITPPSSTVATSGISSYLPPAKLGGGSFIYVYGVFGVNYYGLSAATAIDTNGALTSSPTLTVQQAYQMDKKVDDGLPATGNVIVNYITAGVVTPAPHAASASPATCWDATTYTYSVTQNSGLGTNCGISFRFQ
jgi:prepilin-type N-terminal cleavage/methylation domain-containing protein